MTKTIKDMHRVELISEISRVNDLLRKSLNSARNAKKDLVREQSNIRKVAMKFAQTDIPDSEIRGVARRLFGAVAYGDVEMVSRIMSSYNCVGFCRNCSINLYGDRERPSRKAMPCGVTGCPFKRWRQAGVSTT